MQKPTISENEEEQKRRESEALHLASETKDFQSQITSIFDARPQDFRTAIFHGVFEIIKIS